MINVLHSELENNIGGIETFLINLTKSINDKDIHFDFLMRGSNSYIEKEILSTGATIYKVPNNLLKYYFFIKKLLLKKQYDYVHVHKNSSANILLPMMVKKYSNARLIVHSHNTNPSNGSKFVIFLHNFNKKYLIRLSDYRFACSDKAAIWMFGNNYKALDVNIIKNGIIARNYDFNSKIRTKIREYLDIKNDFVIGNIGAFRKQKNHQFLIKMFSKLSIPNKKLVLVGVGPLEEQIKPQVKELGIQNKVLFLGKREDVPDLLQAFDVFVMPSLWEGLSVSAIEAQASGLPLLLSDKVSKLTRLSNDVKFLPLDDLAAWDNSLIKINDNFIRRSTLKTIISQGYDITNSARILTNFYKVKK